MAIKLPNPTIAANQLKPGSAASRTCIMVSEFRLYAIIHPYALQAPVASAFGFVKK